jgi:hypothetical protein
MKLIDKYTKRRTSSKFVYNSQNKTTALKNFAILPKFSLEEKLSRFCISSTSLVPWWSENGKNKAV